MPRYHELIVNPGTGQQRFNKRMELLQRIEAHTGRPVIVYAANMKLSNIPNSIDLTDVTPFSDLTHSVGGRSIDVILHSPGGTAEAAERIVHLLRARFDSVRFVIPHSAFSAATMLALSADQLLLDDTSALGPTDPQILLRDPQSGQTVAIPTQALTDGFENAKAAIKNDPETLGVYLPLLSKLDLHLFEICKNAEALSKSLVTQWLKSYLLRGEDNLDARAEEVTNYFASQKDRLFHGRSITLSVVKNDLKIKNVVDLRDDPQLRDMIGELWAEIEWFMDNSPTAKFFENCHGVAFRRTIQVQQQSIQIPFIPVPMPPQPQPQAPPAATPAPPPGVSSA